MILSSIKVFSPPSGCLSLHIHDWSQRNKIAFNASNTRLCLWRGRSLLYYINTLWIAFILSEFWMRKTLVLPLRAHFPGSFISSPSQLKQTSSLVFSKRTRPLLKDVSLRRTLYLSLVKSQLSYATHVWSPAQVGLKANIERVQRRPTRWILQSKVGELSYREILLKLLIPSPINFWQGAERFSLLL